jgi:hypothetical protein
MFVQDKDVVPKMALTSCLKMLWVYLPIFLGGAGNLTLFTILLGSWIASLTVKIGFFRFL